MLVIIENWQGCIALYRDIDELQQLTNEGEKLFPKNMSPYNLSKYKIKNHLSHIWIKTSNSIN